MLREALYGTEKEIGKENLSFFSTVADSDHSIGVVIPNGKVIHFARQEIPSARCR